MAKSVEVLRAKVESAFGAYLTSNGFSEARWETSSSLSSQAYKSPDFWLCFFLEGDGDLYAKVSSVDQPESSFYLGATLAFLAGMPQSYLGIESLSHALPENHSELVSLLASGGEEKRKELELRTQAYAQRSLGALQQMAAAAKSKRKWWQFGA